MNNKKTLRWAFFIIFIPLILSGCGPGQIFGHTITPTPTQTPIPPTRTATPVPPTSTVSPTIIPTDTPSPPIKNSVVDGKLTCTYQVSAYDNSTAKQYLETGINLTQGEKLIVKASGTACFDGSNMNNCNGPNGHPDFDNTNLVGKIGDGGKFHIGTSFQKIIEGETGRLYLGFNDSDYENNSGYFDVTVIVENMLIGNCNP